MYSSFLIGEDYSVEHMPSLHYHGFFKFNFILFFASLLIDSDISSDLGTLCTF